ncbi:MAG: hypothetical protein H6Q30_3090 [Bacteroidetes bacterium]|nr:hypothetical protein [Bacteroidota bacterium]
MGTPGEHFMMQLSLGEFQNVMGDGGDNRTTCTPAGIQTWQAQAPLGNPRESPLPSCISCMGFGAAEG